MRICESLIGTDSWPEFSFAGVAKVVVDNFCYHETVTPYYTSREEAEASLADLDSCPDSAFVGSWVSE